MKRYKIKGFPRYEIDDAMNIYSVKTGKKKKVTITRDSCGVTLYDKYLNRVNRTPLAFYALREEK